MWSKWIISDLKLNYDDYIKMSKPYPGIVYVQGMFLQSIADNTIDDFIAISPLIDKVMLKKL